MDSNWESKLLLVARRSNEEETKEFLRLVDQAFGLCTLDIARVLMKTFSDEPDYGTQERVVSVLATAENAIVTQAILEELPRLAEEAPEWTESLIGLEVDRRPELLQEIAAKMPDNVRSVLIKLLNSEEFQDFYPRAKDIIV